MEDRQNRWRAFELAVALPLPGLERSTPLLLGGFLFALTGAAIAVAISSVWLGVATFGLSLAMFFAATQRYRVHFQASTLGELARVIALCHAKELVTADERWSRGQIEEVIIGLVREVAALPEIDLDAHFVRDLHLD
jgi:hypothetical protein